MSVKYKENLLFLENSGAILHATTEKQEYFLKRSILL